MKRRKTIEKLKDGTFRVQAKYSRYFEPAVGLGKTEMAAWRDLARSLAHEHKEQERISDVQEKQLAKIAEVASQ